MGEVVREAVEGVGGREQATQGRKSCFASGGFQEKGIAWSDDDQVGRARIGGAVVAAVTQKGNLRGCSSGWTWEWYSVAPGCFGDHRPKRKTWGLMTESQRWTDTLGCWSTGVLAGSWVIRQERLWRGEIDTNEQGDGVWDWGGLAARIGQGRIG